MVGLAMKEAVGKRQQAKTRFRAINAIQYHLVLMNDQGTSVEAEYLFIRLVFLPIELNTIQRKISWWNRVDSHFQNEIKISKKEAGKLNWHEQT